MGQLDDLKAATDQLTTAQNQLHAALAQALSDLIAAVQAGASDLSQEIVAIRAAATRAAADAAAAIQASPGSQPTGPSA